MPTPTPPKDNGAAHGPAQPPSSPTPASTPSPLRQHSPASREARRRLHLALAAIPGMGPEQAQAIRDVADALYGANIPAAPPGPHLPAAGSPSENENNVGGGGTLELLGPSRALAAPPGDGGVVLEAPGCGDDGCGDGA